MSKRNLIKKSRSEQPAKKQAAPANTTKSPRRATPQSNLAEELTKAREDDFRSIANLAEMAGVTPAAIRKLEAGKGPVATLLAVFEALPFQVTGLAPGRTFAEQLQNRRLKKDMTLEQVAAKASLSLDAVLELENGGGTVQNLLRLLSVIAPKIRRRAPERAHWGADIKLDRDSRFTPDSFMQPIYDSFGEVDVDPCAHPLSPVVARCRFVLSNGDDGLRDRWSGRLAYVNPPFSRQLDWLRRAYEQWASGNVRTVLCLVPVRTDSEFFQSMVKTKAAEIFFIEGRVKFGSEAGKWQATPFSLMLVAFGATAQQKARLAEKMNGFWLSAGGVVHAASNHIDAEQAGNLRVIGDCSAGTGRDVSTSCASGSLVLDVVCGPRLAA